MKRLLVCVLLSPVLLLPLSAVSQISASDAQELEKIVNELSQIVDEQQTIIENSQSRNEELQNSSESKQKIIDEQQQTIEELKSSLSEPKKSSLLTLINAVMATIISFCGGLLVGILFL